MTGINKYDAKERRRVRRRNVIAKDLHSTKYAQKVIPSGRTKKFINTDYLSDGEFNEDEGYYDDEL